MEIVLILLFFVALIIIFKLLAKKRQKPSDKFAPNTLVGNVYEKKQYLLTAAEQSFLSVLDDIFNQGFRIFGQVRLADVIKVKTGLSSSQRQSAFNRISRKHLDYVICSKDDLSIVGAIELDDRSHSRPDRKQRDTFLNQALATAAVPLLRHPVKKHYDIGDLREKLSNTFGIDLAVKSNSEKQVLKPEISEPIVGTITNDDEEPGPQGSSFKL